MKCGSIVGNRDPSLTDPEDQACGNCNLLSSWNLSVPYHSYSAAGDGAFWWWRRAGSHVLFTTTSLSQCRNFQDLGMPLATSPCQERRDRSSGCRLRGGFKLDIPTLNLKLYLLELCNLREDIQHFPASVHQCSRNENTLLDYSQG